MYRLKPVSYNENKQYGHLSVSQILASKTDLCVNTLSSYNTTLDTTGLFYEHRHDVVQFLMFLGLPQEIQSRNDDAAVVYDKKWQAPPPPDANVTS